MLRNFFHDLEEAIGSACVLSQSSLVITGIRHGLHWMSTYVIGARLPYDDWRASDLALDDLDDDLPAHRQHG
jgi:hypothetical protein